METRKLYYEDCDVRTFSAQVVRCEKRERFWAVTLDATAFYPEGGGQACDLGTLNDAVVVYVTEEGEQVVHLCDRPLAAGSTVTGTIDWNRRFDLMQQHTGEHIVSGIIHKRYGWQNVGFHVGESVMEVDFDGPVPAEDIAAIEYEANQAVWEDIALKCWYPAPEELPNVFYRTKRALPWPVRIVQVPGYDSCACCGVHVKTTGQVGLIKIISCVKFHQGVRMEMVCGRRAFLLMQAVFEQNRQVSQTFSAKMLETGEAARRMNEQLANEKYRASGLEKQLFSAVAQAYAGKADVQVFREGLTPAAVRELADAIAAVCGGTAAVFSQSEAGCNFCLINQNGDVKALGTALTQRFDGRGGGKPGTFQGSLKANKADIESFFKE